MDLILRLYSLISRFVSGIKNILYDKGIFKPGIAPLPVVSVGNISLGGTGKTPLAIEVISWLAAHGRKPGARVQGVSGPVGKDRRRDLGRDPDRRHLEGQR